MPSLGEMSSFETFLKVTPLVEASAAPPDEPAQLGPQAGGGARVGKRDKQDPQRRNRANAESPGAQGSTINAN